MNDNTHWPLMGRAAASRAAKILARYANWQLVEVAAYHGLPLAGFLHNETTALLVAVTDGALAPAMAAMKSSLLSSRSDALIIAETPNDAGLPQVALGLWWSGLVAWHAPLLPWVGEDGTMWAVPAGPARRDTETRAFRLVARHLRGDFVPWTTEDQRTAGLARARAALAQPEGEEE